MKLLAYTSVILLLVGSLRSEDTAIEKYLKMSIAINSQPHQETAIEMGIRYAREREARQAAEQARQDEAYRLYLKELQIQAMQLRAMAEAVNHQEPTYIITTKKK